MDNLHSRGWTDFLNWTKFWQENPDVQKDDGFRVQVEVTSMSTPIRPVVSDAHLLQDLSRLIAGEDIIDTKFWVFGGRRLDGTSGASGG